MSAKAGDCVLRNGLDGEEKSLELKDQTWIEGLKSGNVAIFKEIFECYFADLWYFARKTVSKDVAEDIVQDVMADLWNRRQNIKINSGIAPYLFGAVRNRVVDHTRRDKLIERTENRPESVISMAMRDPEIPVDEIAVAVNLEEALKLALATLPSLPRSVLELRWVHEMSYEQIAEILKISVAAARQNVSRSQKVIRPLLEKFLR